jgi:hypothetical protein
VSSIDQQLTKLLSEYVEKDAIPNLKNRIKVILTQTVPQAIPIEEKYELGNQGDLYVVTKGDKRDANQLTYVAAFAEDKGWNKYHDELVKVLKPTPIMLK